MFTVSCSNYHVEDSLLRGRGLIEILNLQVVIRQELVIGKSLVFA